MHWAIYQLLFLNSFKMWLWNLLFDQTKHMPESQIGREISVDHELITARDQFANWLDEAIRASSRLIRTQSTNASAFHNCSYKLYEDYLKWQKTATKTHISTWIHIFCLLANCTLLYNNSCTMHIHIQINIIELVTRRCNVNWPSDPTDLNISIVLMRRPQWQLKLTNVRAKGFGRVGTQSLWSLFGRKNQWLIMSVALRSPLNWSDLSTMQYVPGRVTSEVK